MNQLWGSWKGLLLGSSLLLALTACSNQAADNQQQQQSQSVKKNNAESAHLHDSSVIPNYHGPKTQTTNVYGNTTSGMGMSVYSVIGSSNLHEGGISSHIRSRLASAGIEGVQAFVLNDTVILARTESHVSSNRYDEMQEKVLNQNYGLSGKGEPDQGVRGAKSADGDSLAQAKEQVKNMFNEEIHILTVTNPQAPVIIDRIATKLHNSPKDSSIAKDITELLQMASNQ
ncbi:hypothetical protein [Paenibacillus solani]|uniref:Sporulation protein n=1 Tax=Paenibacillus solani TaxID=1705565 RepID=A0A0M1P548_9BACL|nr:hypothetical protein [Paenibacillus solani]KOR89169.1 hypothetical protein AM231_08340 [Paenibacillus solani]